MKKNLRIISAAAAALLAVSPVVASGVVNPGSAVVKAANSNFTFNTAQPSTSAGNSTTTTTPTTRPYFTYDNQPINEATSDNPTGNVVPTTITIQANDDTNKIAKEINDLNIEFHSSNDGNAEKLDASTSGDAIRAALASHNVVFKSNDRRIPKGEKDAGKLNPDYFTIKSLPSSDFNLTISRTVGNQTATIQIPFVVSSSSSSTDTDAPVIGWSVNNKQQMDGKNVASVNNQVFQVAVGSQFDPTNFVDSNGDRITISAQQNNNNSTYASVSATSNPVNTSEAGRYYNVTLTATGLTGKTATATYTVLITSSAKQPLYGNGTINTYRIYGNNVLSGSTTFKTGDQVYVADATKTIDKVSYSQVSTTSKSAAAHSNVWVRTADLTKPATPATPAETSEEHTVMITSKAYDKNGNYLGHDYQNYTTINIVPKVETINGKTYYKVAGKDEYVRVTNITGTPRTLRHNAYIYWSSYRRTPGTGKMYRGQHVTTYGAAMTFKNGKRYYRIDGCRPGNKRYIKQANFF